MIKLERILCPTDLSEDSERTLCYAVALARSSGAKLFVCHCPKSPVDEEEVVRTIQTLIAAAQTFASGITDALDWESVLLDDSDLGTVIPREAESRRADLIFMRSRRRPFAAALLGSTAETVSRLAPFLCLSCMPTSVSGSTTRPVPLPLAVFLSLTIVRPTQNWRSSML